MTNGPARRLIDTLTQDIRYTLRGMRRRPGFAAMIVLTLSLGIGANATMFGIVDRLLFRPPAHIQDVDRVVQFHSYRLGSTGVHTSQPYAIYRDLQRMPEFEHVAVTTPSSREFYPMGRGVSSSRVAGAQVSPGFFPLLGVRPHRGRFFHEAESGSETGAEKLAVLGYRFWQRHFGGVDAALGQTIDLGTDRYTIVGVTPEGFTGIELSDVDVWIPIAAADGLRFAKGPDWATTRNSQWLYVIARLAPGANLARAEAQATAIFRAGERERATATTSMRTSPDSFAVSLTSILPAKNTRTFGLGRASTELRVSRLLGGVSVMVLLMACVNVATLLLVRAMARRREIAVRLALGVTRRRLVSQLLTEGVVLSLLGAVGALLCAHFASGSIRAILLADRSWTGSAVDGRLLAYTAMAALLAGVVTSLLPALHASREDVSASLKSGSREGSVQRSPLRVGLLATQAAFAVVLLAGAGLFVGSLRNVANLPLGVDVDRMLTAEVQHGSVGMSNAEVFEMFRRFTEAAKTVPGISHAATTIGMTFGLGWGVSLHVPGREQPEQRNNPSQYAVTPEYFSVMGIRLLSGRTFTDADGAGAPLVAVINETTARTFWADENPVGQCVRIRADTMPCTTVIGIVSNARRQQLVENPVSQVYRPLDQVPAAESDNSVSFFGLTLVARTSRKPASMAEPLRVALQQADIRAPYIHVRPFIERVDRFTRSWRLGATLFTIFGALALVLAAVGLYSVVTFTIAQRQQEFGVRVALGASGGSLVRLNVVRGVAPALVGIGVGLVAVLVAGKFVQELLFQLSPRNPVILGTVALLLLVAAVLASLVPSLRAARVDPAIVLRAD